MTSGDKRLDRLYPALSAKERALLVLHAMNEDRDADPAIRWSMPVNQQPAYHRLIGTINALNCDLASVIMILHEQAEKVGLRLAWLQTLQLWGMETGVLRTLLRKHGKPLAPEARRALKTMLRRAPTFGKLPFDLERPVSEEPVLGAGYGDEVARAVARSLRDSLLQHWPEVRAIEIVVEEVRYEFAGEDPLHPEVRGFLDGAKAALVEVHAAIEPYAGKVELPEPGNEEVARVRKLIAKVIEG